MRFYKKIGLCFLLALTLLLMQSDYSMAVTEAEVQEQVKNVGKEVVNGNFIVWFLCAIAFLKISQKMDSFLSSLGLNVGQTGGSLMEEAMIAGKTIAASKNILQGGSQSFRGGSASQVSKHMSSMSTGGLANIVGRHVTQNAKNSVTNQDGNGISKKIFESSANKGGNFATSIISEVAKGNRIQTGVMQGETAEKALTSYLGFNQDSDKMGGIQPIESKRAMQAGTISPSPASDVKGLATGNARTSADLSTPKSTSQQVGGLGISPINSNRTEMHTGNVNHSSIASSNPDGTGSNESPMKSNGFSSNSVPVFSDVEIGGGWISGTETSEQYPDGTPFTMYNTEQYMTPTKGEYETVTTTDHATWYKQYAQNAVDRTPYMKKDGKIGYREKLVQKLPDPPKRKDRV